MAALRHAPARVFRVPPERYGRAAAWSLGLGIAGLMLAFFFLSWLVLGALLVLSCGGNNCPGSTQAEGRQRAQEAILLAAPFVLTVLISAVALVRGIVLLLLRAHRDGLSWQRIGAYGLVVVVVGSLIILMHH